MIYSLLGYFLFFLFSLFSFVCFFPSLARTTRIVQLMEDKLTFLLLTFSPSTLYIVGTFLLHQILFWSITLPLLYLDLTRSPTFLYKYKIQNNHHITLNDAKKCMKTVIFNQIFVLLPYIIIFYYTIIARGGLDFAPTLPKWYVIILIIFIICIIICIIIIIVTLLIKFYL